MFTRNKSFFVLVAAIVFFMSSTIAVFLYSLNGHWALSALASGQLPNALQVKLIDFPVSLVEVPSGGEKQLILKIENIGESVLYRKLGGSSTIMLKTNKPVGRDSVFYDSDTWNDKQSISFIDRKISPSEEGTFQFNLHAPSEADYYREYFRLEGNNYIGPEFYIDIKVGNPEIQNLVTNASESISASHILELRNMKDLARYNYEYVALSSYPQLMSGETAIVWVDLKNTGLQPWYRDSIYSIRLGTSRELNRESQFAGGDWINKNRIQLLSSEVKPGAIGRFQFQIVAPTREDVYREYFQPVVDGIGFLEDQGLYIDIMVGAEQTFDKIEGAFISTHGDVEKSIKVDLAKQRLYLLEDTEVVREMIISSGGSGHRTPTGHYHILNKQPNHYSRAYDLYMEYSMQFTPQGHFLHRLPYWALRNGGKLYEGEQHLGRPVSHGCVRVGINDSKILYDWGRVGMAVDIS